MAKVDSNVVVVGGSSGLGKVIARIYAELGYGVSIISRNKPAFIGELENAKHFSVDLTTISTDYAKALARQVCAEAGVPNYMIFCQRYRGTDRNLANEAAVSLAATADLIEAFSETFSHQGDKAIAVVSSVYGDFVGSSQPLSYHVVKAGLNALVRYYAVSLGRKGIRINAISPLTYLKEESQHVYLNNKNTTDKYAKLVPLKRMGTAQECANTIRFLCSEQSSFITGQNLYVDGGVSVVWAEELV